MWIFVWDNAPSKIFVWDVQASKVFVWDTQVRPTSTPRTPDASRTLLYMRFNNNLNDSSGNNVSVTWGWIGYWTVGNNYYVEKTSTNWQSTYIHPTANINSAIGSWDYTVSFFVYNVPHSWCSGMLFWEWHYQAPFRWIYILAQDNQEWTSYNINNQWHNNAWLVLPENAWTHIVCTRVNGVCYRYTNWVPIDNYTDSPQPTPDFSVYPWSEFYLLNRNSSYDWHSWKTYTWAKMSELIFEKVWWSADEVATYFGQQRANYWL